MCIRFKEAGFTLVELLVVMALGTIVMAGLMTTFTTQHKSYLVQDDVAEMQQNLRVAMDLISGDIRSAGYDPTGSADAEIVTASAGRLGFSQDLNGNGTTDTAADTHEEITYGFAIAEDTAPFDGIADAGPADLGRNNGSTDGTGGSGFTLLAKNIYGIEFFYILDDGTQTLTPTTSQLGEIRSIVVSILAVSNTPSPNFDNSGMSQQTGSGVSWPLATKPIDSDLRWRMMVSTVHCRNIGL